MLKEDTFQNLKTILEQDYLGNKAKLIEDIKLFLYGENKYYNDSDLNSLKSNSQKQISTNKIIQLIDISKEYKMRAETIYALKNINIEIFEGEMIAIVGPSGSGKSTLLQIIGALDKPTTGTISVNQEDIAKLNDSELSNFRNKTIGFVFQSFYLQPYLNVQQNIEIPLIFGGTSRKNRKQLSLEAAEAVGLKDRLLHLPKQLSGGQMQRVAIARAIVNKPKILLADEPTANVDKNTTIEILKLFQEINKNFGTTIVIVTHNELVANATDRQLKLSDGEIIKQL